MKTLLREIFVDKNTLFDLIPKIAALLTVVGGVICVIALTLLTLLN